MARQRYITSGCGKGVTFSSIRDALTLTPIAHRLSVEPEQLVRWQRRLEEGAELYRATRGLHGAAVAHVDRDEVLVREDIGRHNAGDKALGVAHLRVRVMRLLDLVSPYGISLTTRAI